MAAAARPEAAGGFFPHRFWPMCTGLTEAHRSWPDVHRCRRSTPMSSMLHRSHRCNIAHIGENVFPSDVCRAFPGLDDLVCHLITDGDKGLKAAVRDCLPQAYHATCAFHRAQKLSEQRKTMPLLLKMAEDGRSLYLGPVQRGKSEASE